MNPGRLPANFQLPSRPGVTEVDEDWKSWTPSQRKVVVVFGLFATVAVVNSAKVPQRLLESGILATCAGSSTDGAPHSFRDEHRIRGSKIQLCSTPPPESPLLAHVQHNPFPGEFESKARSSFSSQARHVSPDLSVLVDSQGNHISSLGWTIEVIGSLFRSYRDRDLGAQPLYLDGERIDG